MLKIYRKSIKYYLKSKKFDGLVHGYSGYVIKDENSVNSSVAEISVYDDDIEKCAYWILMHEKKKGRHVLLDTTYGIVSLKQWKDPDAKIVLCIKYEETSCSMKELLNLDANKVIAYLKQEGLSISLPS